VELSYPAQLEAFGQGTIDLTATVEPWIARMINTGDAVLWAPAQEVLPDFQISLIVYGPNLLEDNPGAGQRFMTAYLKALRQYKEGKTERNVEIVAKHTELDPALLKQACWPSIHADGQINVQSVLDFQAWAAEKGFLDSPITADQFWDPSFIEQANEDLGDASP
jgi:NitT/TauT family transport system substrate-binding protein